MILFIILIDFLILLIFLKKTPNIYTFALEYIILDVSTI